MKKVNNKGFTLIELLAVIVILAILIMVAMPAVTSLMEKAKVGAFVTEGESFAKATQTAYTASLVGGGHIGTTYNNVNVTGMSNGNGAYTYFCMKVQDLITKGYIEKANYSKYAGIVEAFIPTSTNTSTPKYIVSMTNDEYAINGVSLTNMGGNTYLDSGVGSIRSGKDLKYTDCATDSATALKRVTDTGSYGKTVPTNFN